MMAVANRGLGEDHYPGGRLDEMGAGARADDEEEGVLDLAMQPDDPGEAAEYRPLAALLPDLDAAGGVEVAELGMGIHRAPSGERTRRTGPGAGRRAASAGIARR